MANRIYEVEAVVHVISDTTDYSNNRGFGARTDQIDLTGLTDTSARQCAKVDLVVSAALMPTRFDVDMSLEFATVPGDDKSVDLYVGFSHHATAATGNPGGLSGVDAAYAGTTGGTLTEGLLQLIHLGRFHPQNDEDPVVQQQQTGSFVAEGRYAMFVVVNNSGVALHSDAVEMAIRVAGMALEVQ